MERTVGQLDRPLDGQRLRDGLRPLQQQVARQWVELAPLLDLIAERTTWLTVRYAFRAPGLRRNRFIGTSGLLRRR